MCGKNFQAKVQAIQHKFASLFLNQNLPQPAVGGQERTIRVLKNGETHLYYSLERGWQILKEVGGRVLVLRRFCVACVLIELTVAAYIPGGGSTDSKVGEGR